MRPGLQRYTVDEFKTFFEDGHFRNPFGIGCLGRNLSLHAPHIQLLAEAGGGFSLTKYTPMHLVPQFSQT
jgi:hypothetical protein